MQINIGGVCLYTTLVCERTEMLKITTHAITAVPPLCTTQLSTRTQFWDFFETFWKIIRFTRSIFFTVCTFIHLMLFETQTLFTLAIRNNQTTILNI